MGDRRNVTLRTRAEFALNRYIDHVFRKKRDDRALNERVTSELSKFGPGQRRPLDVVEDIEPKAFFERYFRTGMPVVLRGLARDWPCVKKWSPGYLKKKYGHEPLSVMDNINDGGVFNVEELTIGQFMDMVESGDTRKHLRFGNILHRFPELVDDFDADTMSRYMNKIRVGRNFGAFIGAKGTQTRLHSAPPDNLFVQVYGKKRWTFVPSCMDPALKPVMARSTYYWTEFDPDNPDYDAYPAMRYVDTYEVVLEPGDVLYNPPSFWHQVTNETATIGVGFRWMSPMAARLNWSQFMLFFLATNPPLWFVLKNKKQYTKVLEAAEQGNRKIYAGSSDAHAAE